jgi:hypothetical protein
MTHYPVNPYEGELIVNDFTARRLMMWVEYGELLDSKDKNLISIQGILAEVESKK